MLLLKNLKDQGEIADKEKMIYIHQVINHSPNFYSCRYTYLQSS